ncbi:177_t:CDS:2 [Entrophospora sp. SA101]|nr:1901_t:CDS:2 [Entrophospora sp. SA101]CAJ0749747.1 23933_t:CDS:2 [Entrophospora sp. SA101]CAJ0752815.1 7061_t:CDS:2 [Entrophospora sp. SA101]CAJ0756345.1 177_t:CDS:2 [Entrophospora sp. SA101]
MESFLVKFKPISAITIFTALYKRVEAGEWTDDREEEIENFAGVLETALKLVSPDEEERWGKLHSFRNDKTLEQRVSEAFDHIRSSLELNALKKESKCEGILAN